MFSKTVQVTTNIMHASVVTKNYLNRKQNPFSVPILLARRQRQYPTIMTIKSFASTINRISLSRTPKKLHRLSETQMLYWSASSKVWGTCGENFSF